MDKTPCTQCVAWLRNQYKNSPKGSKPTMYVSYLFSYFDTKESKEQSVKALRELHEDGFKICPADIQEFGSLFTKYYQDFIKEVAKTDAFRNGQNTLKNYLQGTCN